MSFIDVGPGPADEDVAQVGSEDYFPRARKECFAFRRQLRRQFGPEPEGAGLMVRSNPHEFGAYLSVECVYNTKFHEAVEYAFRVDSAAPLRWDTEARLELGLDEVIKERH